MNVFSQHRAAWKDRIAVDQAAANDATAHLLSTRRDCQLAEDALALAAAKVEFLRAEVHLLEQRQTAADEQLARSRAASLRIVVSNLPDDVLCCIFTCCAELTDILWGEPGTGSFNRVRATLPFTLAAVCTRWRRVALDYGGLWTYISLPYHITEERRDSHHGRFEHLLSRSQMYPLDVLLGVSEVNLNSATDDAAWITSVFSSICRHAHRWRRVQIAFSDICPPTIAAVFKGPLPKLKELSLRGPESEDWLVRDSTAARSPFLPHVPLLEALDLSLTGMAVASAHEGFPSLVSLKVKDDMDRDSLLHLLELSQSTLQELDLELRFDGPDSYSLSLPHMHTLALHCELFFVPYQSPISLHAPQLRALTLRSADEMVDDDLSLLFEHVSATVTELTLYGNVDGNFIDVDGNFIDVFAHLRNLERVGFGTRDSPCGVDDDFLVALATRTPSVWPRLYDISFYNAEIIPVHGDGIVQLVAARNVTPPSSAHDADISERPCRLREVQFAVRAPQWTIAEVERLLSMNV